MAKAKTMFVCQSCGHEQPRWMGRCPGCDQWNTMVEQVVAQTPKNTRIAKANRASLNITVPAEQLSDVPLDENQRMDTGNAELNRVLGGGLVPGSLVLLGGDPGIGKSTLLLQVCHQFALSGLKPLYVTGEESRGQVRMRAGRLGIGGEGLFLLPEMNMDEVEAQADALTPGVMVVDSIQTMLCPELTGAPGSVSQVRECASRLLRYAKSTGCAVFLVGHVTKEGALAGPRVLEHMVDTVLYFEGDAQQLRILRAVKNRFGSTNEIGVFEMTGEGMREVADPSALFARRQLEVPGAVVLSAMEGTRPVLVEVQALVSQTAFGNPRRMVSGADYNRTVLILAVLEKRGGLVLYNQDAYVSIAGGLRIDEPAADLAIAAAVVSGFRGRPLGGGTAVMGEIGLTGEVRPVAHAERRLIELKKQGYTRAILPKGNLKTVKNIDGLEIAPIAHIVEMLSLF